LHGDGERQFLLDDAGLTLAVDAGATAPRKAGSSWLATLAARLLQGVFAVIGALLILVPAMIASSVLGWSNHPLLTFALVLGFWLLATLIHELGHAAMAWAVGWDVHVISVARINYLPKQWRFGALPQFRRSRLSGFVLATPADAAQWESRRYLLFVLGGPLANAAVGVVCVGVLSLARPESVFAILVLCFGMSSFVYGLLNLIPVRWSSGRRSDGARLIDYLFRRKRPQLAYARARMSGLGIDGVPQRRWDPALAERVLSDDHDPDWLLSAAASFLAAGRLAKALAAVRAVQAAKPGFEVPLPALVAFLIAMVDRDTAEARRWLAKCSGAEQNDFAYWRAHVVILAIEGRWDDARGAVAKARAVMATSLTDEDDKRLLAAIEQGRDPSTALEQLHA
jgi:hypothetical protein